MRTQRSCVLVNGDLFSLSVRDIKQSAILMQNPIRSPKSQTQSLWASWGGGASLANSLILISDVH